jgi:hypothetical protein
MLLAPIIVFNGVLTAATPVAIIRYGHVMAPLAVLARTVESIRRSPAGDIVLVNGTAACKLRVNARWMQCEGHVHPLENGPFISGETIYVPIADIIRGLGGEASYDPQRRVLSLRLETHPLLQKMLEPSGSASASPPSQATPHPAETATPRAYGSGDPRPRRTGIPAAPSR